MIHHIFEFLKIVFVLAAIASIFYYGLCIWSTTSFLREQKAADKGVRPTESHPSVSILKPLKGTDPEMYESFRSHCLQDYPEYEIIFGVSEPDDPAVEAVQRLIREFPLCRIRLVICPATLGTNRKTSNLAQMLPHACHEHDLVNDS